MLCISSDTVPVPSP
ncbi:hypothetical protein [Plasmodium yoelii yoelii]|uniref:Uncharacterized protein n=1 Tax=Plasmodium yoelii yoelii TaxID=73239 RepID=Q7R7H2_PLAYO|nr:hypothetical protein [Plasmodium yoelii yoelii]